MDNKEFAILKNKTLVQHNAITMARYELTACEKNIIYMLLAQLDKDDPNDRVYKIYLHDMERLTNSDLNYEQIKKATMKLISRPYVIKDDGNLLQVNIISSAKYIKGSGYIALRVDPEMRPYLFDLKKEFTKYSLSIAISLESKYSKRLYEMLSQFKSTRLMRITVQELKYRLEILDVKSGKDKYVNWATFSKKVLETAKKEINELTDISFDYKAKKTGRMFTDLEFTISCNNAQIPLSINENNKASNIYQLLTEKFKLSPWQAKIIVTKLEPKDIHKTLYDIEIANINNKVANIGGFTATTFENKYKVGLAIGKINYN